MKVHGVIPSPVHLFLCKQLAATDPLALSEKKVLLSGRCIPVTQNHLIIFDLPTNKQTHETNFCMEDDGGQQKRSVWIQKKLGTFLEKARHDFSKSSEPFF